MTNYTNSIIKYCKTICDNAVKKTEKDLGADYVPNPCCVNQPKKCIWDEPASGELAGKTYFKDGQNAILGIISHIDRKYLPYYLQCEEWETPPYTRALELYTPEKFSENAVDIPKVIEGGFIKEKNSYRQSLIFPKTHKEAYDIEVWADNVKFITDNASQFKYYTNNGFSVVFTSFNLTLIVMGFHRNLL